MCTNSLRCLQTSIFSQAMDIQKQVLMANYLQVSYAIGVAQPLSVFVDTYGTGTIPDKEILAKILEKFDFRPGS